MVDNPPKIIIAYSRNIKLISIYYTDFNLLLGDLERANHSFPKVYQDQVIIPFIKHLTDLGATNFYALFAASDSDSMDKQQRTTDFSMAILAYTTPYSDSIGALQEILSDLYDGFLSQEDRVSKETGVQIKPPDKSVLPPLAFFGDNDVAAPLNTSNNKYDDPHPADVARGFLCAEAVKNLSFDGAAEWSEVIFHETQKDVDQIKLGGQSVTVDEAAESAQITARTIMLTKLTTLQGHSFKEIQDWTNKDQEIADKIQTLLASGTKLTQELRGNRYYAAHVVAAATTEALKEQVDIQTIFNRMKEALNEMHHDNKT